MAAPSEAPPPPPERARAMVKWLGFVGVFLAALVIVGTQHFFGSGIDGVIGPNPATIQPTTDGHVTLDLGAVGAARLPLSQPFNLGVSITVHSSSLPFEEQVADYSQIASHPEGELASLRESLTQHAIDSLEQGVMGGVLTVIAAYGLYRLVRDHRHIWTRLHHRAAAHPRVTAVSVLCVGGLLVASPFVVGTPVDVRPTPSWQRLGALLPPHVLPPELQGVELSGVSATFASQIAKPFVQQYIDSEKFYGALVSEFNAQARDAFPPAQRDDVVLVHISDRHNNIGMDPLVEAVVRASKADLIVDTGDDTSSGNKVEAFSINSLAAHTAGRPVVAIGGNHDSQVITEMMRAKKFTVLEGSPVKVAGITFLGTSDPRHSNLGLPVQGSQSFGAFIAKSVKDACATKGVDLFLSHDPRVAQAVVGKGCAGDGLAGHVHHQALDTYPIDGVDHYVYTSGTTGGAVESSALGSSLRAQAEITVLIWRNGRLVSYQPVLFNPAGTVTIEPQHSFPTSGSPLHPELAPRGT